MSHDYIYLRTSPTQYPERGRKPCKECGTLTRDLNAVCVICKLRKEYGTYDEPKKHIQAEQA